VLRLSRRGSFAITTTSPKTVTAPLQSGHVFYWYNGYISLMRLEFDRAKSRSVKRKHAVSLKAAQQIFDQTYLIDQRNDDPEQFRAIGWCDGRLCSVIFEISLTKRASTTT